MKIIKGLLLLGKISIAFFKKDLIIDTSYRLQFLGRWIGIVISVFTFYFIAQLIGGKSVYHLAPYGGEYFPFVLTGLATIGFLNANVSGYMGLVLGEQRYGTLEVFLSMPVTLPMILFALTFYNLVMGALAAAFYLFFGAWLGVDFSMANLFSYFFIMTLATAIFLSLGIIASSLVLIFKRGDPISWIISNFFWLLGGVYFPVSIFPESIQRFSSYIPSTYVFDAVRFSLLKGYSLFMLKDQIFALGIFTVPLLILAYATSRAAIFYAKKRGTIIFY